MLRCTDDNGIRHKICRSMHTASRLYREERWDELPMFPSI